MKRIIEKQSGLNKKLAEMALELDTVKVERDAAVKALDEALIMDNHECFDGENFPCGYRPWCGLCDENEERGCAKAYMEWRGPQKEE